MKLIIVESPTKARTISRFIGRDFKVESSYGHVRDLPSYELAVDTEHDFTPHYVIPRKAQKTVKRLKEEAKKAGAVIMATDEDREGEAIAWHLVQALGLSEQKTKNEKRKTIERIVFHEITKGAIEEALKNPRQIDLKLVDAQQARRILDRLVGYRLSPFLWKKIMGGLSAGRVQSVALRLIVEREKEILDFKPETYFSIEALLQKDGCENNATAFCKEFPAKLSAIDDKPLDKLGVRKENEVREIIEEIKNSLITVKSFEKRALSRFPLPPFTTSTLQQTAWQHFKFSAKKTMFLAQQLYEGVEIKGEGSIGLITYMRTDSLNVAKEALEKAKKFLEKSLGEKYGLAAPRYFKTKSKSAQEAHEAIRPTDPGREPQSIKDNLTRDQYRLYELIWRRFVASQMPPAIFESTNMAIEAKTKKIYRLSANGIQLRFDGFMKIWPSQTEETTLPEIEKGSLLKLKNIEAKKHETQPPPRYTEASLVKILEKFGIGRPSTYAPTMSTIQERGYVKKDPAKHFVPTEIGEKVTDLLVEHFPQIVDVDFTAQMEENLDEIAEGKKEWIPVIKEFYGPFAKLLEEKYQSVEKEDLTQKTDEVCGLCGRAMIIRYGRFGKFLACSGFPECKNTKQLPPTSLHIPCPQCLQGEIVERTTRKGRTFYGCSRYPECKFATWQKPINEKCPKCGSILVEKNKIIACSNKECEYKKSP